MNSKYEPGSTESVTAIKYKDFRPIFENKKKANFQLSLNVKPGFKYLLKGKNGAGKSTTLEVLGRDVDYEGRLWINGKEILQKSDIDGYHLVTPVKDGNLFDSVDIIRKCYENSVGELFQQVAALFSDLLRGDFQQKGFSQGERQLLSLLHALANAPSILIIDETLSSVEESLRLRIYTILLEQQGVAIVVVDHTLGEEMEKKFDEVFLFT